MEVTGQLLTYRVGEMLTGGQVKSLVAGAVNHGLTVDLEVDSNHFSVIFEDQKPKYLGTKEGKPLEEMLPKSEPHPHSVRVVVTSGLKILNEIYYTPEDARYRVLQ